jgi:rubrerythrin
MKQLNLHQLIELALKAEEKGASVYTQLSEKFSQNPELSEVFKLLAKDEQIHYNQFLALKKELPETLDNVSEVDDEFFRCVNLERYFDFFVAVEEVLEKILKVAYKFERETYVFYNAVRDVIGNNEVLNKIIEYEKSHMIKLFNYLLTESKFRGISDKF